MSLFTHQPRWLLLSVFLVLWSWSSGFRRDGSRTKALGLGVEARLPPFDGTWHEKRQMGLPVCAQRCAVQATQDTGCGTSLNFACSCHQPNFMADAVNCMTDGCSATDKAMGQSFLGLACKQVGTSVSVPTSFPVSSTSITSGIPPVCTTGSPTSAAASGTTTVSVTVTVTAGSSSAPPASSSSASASAPASASGPVLTVTATETVTVSGSPTAPVTSGSGTVVVSTSTLAPSGSGVGGNGGGNAARGLLEGVPVAAVGAAVLAAAAGMLVVL